MRCDRPLPPWQPLPTPPKIVTRFESRAEGAEWAISVVIHMFARVGTLFANGNTSRRSAPGIQQTVSPEESSET